MFKYGIYEINLKKIKNFIRFFHLIESNMLKIMIPLGFDYIQI